MRQSDDTVLCVTELLGRLVLEDDEHTIKRVLRCVLAFLPRLPWREGCPATQQVQYCKTLWLGRASERVGGAVSWEFI